MKKYLILALVLVIPSLVGLKSHAHEINSYKSCPLCKFFSDEGLIEKSKEELLKIKESIEQHLSRDNLANLGNEAIESLQGVLDKVNEKLKEK